MIGVGMELSGAYNVVGRSIVFVENIESELPAKFTKLSGCLGGAWEMKLSMSGQNSSSK